MLSGLIALSVLNTDGIGEGLCPTSEEECSSDCGVFVECIIPSRKI